MHKPLETLEVKDHCEMCGDHDKGARHRAHLEPGYDPSGQAKTLCQSCRIGSAELLRERDSKRGEFIALVSRMKTEEDYGDEAPPSEDWISALNDLIETARQIEAATKSNV